MEEPLLYADLLGVRVDVVSSTLKLSALLSDSAQNKGSWVLLCINIFESKFPKTPCQWWGEFPAQISHLNDYICRSICLCND